MPGSFTRICLIAVAACTVMLAALTPAWAAKVTITGTEAAIVDVATGVFVFDGPVTLTDGDTTIYGNYVTYHRDKELVEFRGDVRVVQGDRTLTGRDLVYDAKKGEGSINQALITGTPIEAVAPVFISGEKVQACSTRTVVEGARLTTCEGPNPGYYMAARTIEIYPGDKLVLYGVRFVESGITLFYWPRLTFSLKRLDPDRDVFSLPRIGYSSTEGWFIKNSFGYRGPGTQYGSILLDYMQLLGWGVGVDHVLRSTENRRERLHVYVQPNKSTGNTDFTVAFEEQAKLAGNVEFSGSTSYQNTSIDGEQTQFENRISLHQDRANGSTSLSYSDTRLEGVESGYEMVGRAAHTQSYGGGWQLRVTGDVNKRDRTDYTYRNLVGYMVEVDRNTADWGFNFTAEDRFNPDLAEDTNTDPITWNRAQRLPEFTLRVNRISMLGRDTPFTLDAAWGRLTETQYGSGQRVGTQRTHVAAHVKPLHFNLGFLGSLEWRGSATRRSYSSGEQQWVAAANSEYKLPISDRLTLTGNYTYEQGFGDVSPFYFDRVTDTEEVEARLDYRTDWWQWSLSAGYDIWNAEPLDIVGSIRLQPSKVWKFQAQGAYNPAYDEWLYVIGTAQYTPSERLTLNLGAKYDVQAQLAERVDALFQWDLGGWKLGYTGSYDGIDQEYDLGDFTITRDLGCRAIDLRYNQYRKEVWLEYRITAFPSASVKLGATDKHLMFDARGWEEVLATE